MPCLLASVNVHGSDQGSGGVRGWHSLSLSLFYDNEEEGDHQDTGRPIVDLSISTADNLRS